jgi:hypothetical protein
MGKLIQGINGPFTGKVGPAVGSSWMGINVIRSLPSRRTRPFTPGELAQQMKFKLLTAFLLRVMPLMNITFKNLAVRMTGFNKGYSYNIKNVFTGEYPNLSIDYSLVLLSRGDLPNAGSPSAISSLPNRLEFSWTDNTRQGKALQTDKAFVAAFCEEKNDWKYELNVADRSTGRYSLDLKVFSGKSVHGYIGFLSSDGTEVSDSIYTGIIQIQNEHIS